MLSGARGDGVRFAMRMIVRLAEQSGAERLIDVCWAHVASAYLQGPPNLDFARRIAAGNTTVAIPTTLTSCALNLFKCEAGRGTRAASELIDIYKDMGCDPVMTCAPYHTREEPGFGDNLAWCESSAVVYANSVLGARSNRYVEFVDMCAAVTGRVPDCGLHRTAERRATVLFRIANMPDGWLEEDWFFHVLGILIGLESGSALPAIAGLRRTTGVEQLRALGSAAASSGSVSIFHAIGITPEANSIKEAFHGQPPSAERLIDADEIRRTAAMLSDDSDKPLTAICVGAPHFSFQEFQALDSLLGGRKVAKNLELYASTSAAVIAELESANMLERLMKADVQFVVGRCTYYHPAMPGTNGRVMTNSAKWAYYAPSGLGASVLFGSLNDCVESACAGRAIKTGAV